VSLGYTQKRPDVRGAFASDVSALKRVHTDAMGDLVGGFKEELRDMVRGAGLGERLAKTWQGKVFAAPGGSLDPAGFVWSKAPTILSAFAYGATIVPLAGRRYLAIPTKNVPFKSRGRRMSPLDVEVAFNQDLIIRRGKQGRLLGFVNPTLGRRRRRGLVQLVLMFTFTRLARLAKRFDTDEAFARWAAKYDGLVQTRWDASPLARGS
jgi:hypothetical protein